MKLSVIIPAHNEEENIVPLLEALESMFAESGLEGETIVIDDGSTDATLQRLEEGGRNRPFLRVVRHLRRRGITAALETGFAAARGEVLVFYPADLQYHPRDIPSLVARVDEGYDIVTGWRQGKYGKKRVVSSIYNRLSRIFFKVSVHDLNGVKAFRREVVADLQFQPDWHRYLVVLAASRGWTVSEVKVPLYPRRHGSSKFKSDRVLRAFWDFVVVLFVVKFSQKPMVLFGNLGLIFIGIGMALSVYLSYLHFLGQKIGDRPLLLLAILLLVTGIQFFALGLLGELIGRRRGRQD
ncbi:MAG TPA: glycosyltransferase family 2 protein [bacterium]|nr:glycosyltransferase family 2 protein [bacterium]HPJ72654.1 glycosyltransferase family 2 protein [bacterium]HPQ67163.1 glycosyltransferase family 2 protein [bacterium]